MQMLAIVKFEPKYIQILDYSQIICNIATKLLEVSKPKRTLTL